MITLQKIQAPEIEQGVEPVMLSDETMKDRKQSVLDAMKAQGYDALVIYADLEHGANFEYLCGFLPRFEEALLVLHQSGEAYMVLGNENLNKASKSRIPVTPVHLPHFSLPNQPMQTQENIVDILAKTGLANAATVGLVGWKHFTNTKDDETGLFDLPYFIVDAFTKLCDQTIFQNATAIFIGEHGVRTKNNANEFAHYEFGAVLAGNCMLTAMNVLQTGMREMDVAAQLDAYGQTHNVVSIMASGARFQQANMYPSAKTVQLGDPISITTGYKGGLQSRGGFAIETSDQLPKGQEDYLDRVAIPYMQAVVSWLEEIHIGIKGAQLYETMEEVLPKERYGWSLNPGHLCADEEWLSSPIYPESTQQLQSGMLLQIDIIPSVAGYGGISCESGILLADEALRKQIQDMYPALWERIEKRRAYMIHVLGIAIQDEVLPTSMMCAYCRPFLLDKQRAFVKQ